MLPPFTVKKGAFNTPSEIPFFEMENGGFDFPQNRRLVFTCYNGFVFVVVTIRNRVAWVTTKEKEPTTVTLLTVIGSAS